MAEICPHTENCIIYKNWVDYTKDRRIDVIGIYTKDYECLAKITLEDPIVAEGGLVPNDEVKERLTNLSAPCSHITLLNLLHRK